MKGDSFPATDMSLEEAKLYCHKVGGRLPTEAEWEWADKAGGLETRPARPKEYGWFDANAKRSLNPVAKKKPKDWGIYDMLGNVCELTISPWSFELIGGVNSGMDDGDLAGKRTKRSGSCFNREGGMSATFRSAKEPSFKSVQNTCGFRYVVPAID